VFCFEDAMDDYEGKRWEFKCLIGTKNRLIGGNKNSVSLGIGSLR